MSRAPSKVTTAALAAGAHPALARPAYLTGPFTYKGHSVASWHLEWISKQPPSNKAHLTIVFLISSFLLHPITPSPS